MLQNVASKKTYQWEKIEKSFIHGVILEYISLLREA